MKQKIRKLINGRYGVLFVIVVLFLVNWAATEWHTRIDLTSEKRFTLSGPVKRMLKKLDAPVKIDILLKGNYPSGFRKLGMSAGDVLQEFKEVAGNKLQFNFVSPDDLVEGTSTLYRDTASAIGLFPINLTSQLKEGQQQQEVFPVALVRQEEKIQPVMLYEGKSPELMPGT
jgi:hypothetical protein